jgi:hypothetical protein
LFTNARSIANWGCHSGRVDALKKPAGASKPLILFLFSKRYYGKNQELNNILPVSPIKPKQFFRDYIVIVPKS